MSTPGRPTRRVIRIAVAASAVAMLANGTASCSDRADRSDRTTTTAEAGPPSAEFTILQLLGRDAQFATFAALVAAAGEDELLSGRGPLTLLAPDAAALAAASIDPSSAAADPAAARALVRRHVLDGEFSYRDLLNRNGSTVPTVDGTQLPVTVESGQVRVGGVPITKTDVRAGNGVIHVLGGALPAP